MNPSAATTATPPAETPRMNTPWVESPFFEKELRQAGLDPKTEAMVRQYADQGYLVFDPQIPMETIDEARESLIPRFEKEKTTRFQDVWRENKAVQQIAAAPRVLEVLELLYHREPIPFQTLNFNVGTQQRTHSDSIHFDSVPQRFMCGVWVALEDVTDDNGPLHYYPGSHKFPVYNLVDIGLKGSESKSIQDMLQRYYVKYEDFIEAFIAEQGLQRQTLNMKKGQAIIWASNLLHGGDKIKRPGSTRHSQVTHYYFADCAYYAPMLTDMAIERVNIRKITNIATGQEIPSRYLGKDIDHAGYSYKIGLPTELLRKLFPESLRKKLKGLLHR